MRPDGWTPEQLPPIEHLDAATSELRKSVAALAAVGVDPGALLELVEQVEREQRTYMSRLWTFADRQLRDSRESCAQLAGELITARVAFAQHIERFRWPTER